MGHRQPDPSDRSVHWPLSPRILEDVGVLNQIPANDNFQPDQGWTHMYRIWGNHGHYKFQNKDMGYLTIQRDNNADDDHVVLRIHKEIVNADCIVHITEAEIECCKDYLSTPVSWKLTNCFTDTNNNIVPLLTISHEGYVENQTIHQVINGKERKEPVEKPFTCNWCLFDAVQRLDRDVEDFCLLEDLSVVKKNNRLVRLTSLSETISCLSTPLTCAYQVGRGISPNEYWLDDKQRIVVVCVGPFAYILDDHAKHAKEQLVKELKQGGIYYEY